MYTKEVFTMIHISSTDKSTTIRLKEITKKKLEQLAKGKETHEEIILRLIKIVENLSSEQNTNIIQKGNIIGTKYETLHKTIQIKLDDQEYVVVCTYNDLSMFAIMQNKSLNQLSKKLDWTIDLNIVNVNIGKGWVNPKNVQTKELNTLYFICVKQILEETFDIKLYQFSNILDYFNMDNWIEVYKKYDLSKDSLNSDIKRKLI
ncbi:MAG: hypothetical protein PHU51_05235 [Candidatus Nanoarchaeia archaeon]|nr:hypothetical protein [Candidatus Nanoarchaeia archaeon]